MASDDPSVETLLAELNAERSKFSRADEQRMRDAVAYLVACGEYPTEWNGKPIDVWQRVQCWGAYWHRFEEPLECEKCKADLRDLDWGPPGKREIRHTVNDMCAYYSCPDCKHEWPRTYDTDPISRLRR